MFRTVEECFIEQAIACEGLGSDFNGGLCRLFAERLDCSIEVGKLCLDWPGDPHHSADSVPLRLCGGLHALVLSGRDEELATCYPPRSIKMPEWALVERVLVQHSQFLLDWMKSAPQTNEVSRAAVLWPAMMALSQQTGKPLSLLEVGASGGLNLRLDKFGYDLGGVACGTANSPLKLTPEWRGEPPLKTDVAIASRAGCDLNPLEPTSETDALRLMAYCWPDQTDRKARLSAALTIAQSLHAEVEKADAVEWLANNLQTLEEGACTVVYSTIAWQYLPKEAREKGEAIIHTAGAGASGNRPLAWLRFEADGNAPGARIELDLWPNHQHQELGRGDFHGRWVDWRNPDWKI